MTFEPRFVAMYDQLAILSSETQLLTKLQAMLQGSILFKTQTLA